MTCACAWPAAARAWCSPRRTVVDKHDPRGQLRLIFPMEPWERRLYISPRVDPATATALASFVTRALSLPEAR